MVANCANGRDYFISRTDSDKTIAIAIAEIIHEAGRTTWLQDEDFGHASFMARMEQGFDSGARLIDGFHGLPRSSQKPSWRLMPQQQLSPRAPWRQQPARGLLVAGKH